MKNKEWVDVERPAHLAAKRDQKFAEWDDQYGKGNWRLAWRVGESDVDFLGVCAVYEDSYFEFLVNNPNVLDRLINDASEVYDDEITNVRSYLDYLTQETKRTHIQDIAIRRSLVRMGIWFRGSEPIRIRQELGTHPLSMTLSPGRVPFHRPDLIIQPEIVKWWEPQTVESFIKTIVSFKSEHKFLDKYFLI